MLYLPEANLAFIHIPKNAGQSVRRALAEAAPLSFAAMAADLGVDQARAEVLMEAGVDHLPGLGRVQPEHVPLAFLEAHFPHSWAALRRARSFVLVRPPRDRFLSALMQRLREYGGAGMIRADDPAVAAEARRICDWLDGRGPFCDMAYIHFSRQIDYAEVRGERICDAVFPVGRIDAAANWIAAETGLHIAVSHDHARREPKGWASGIQPAARLLGRTLLPLPVRKAIYPIWMKSGVFADAAARYPQVRLGDDVERFIEDYYAADAALHAEAVGHLHAAPLAMA